MSCNNPDFLYPMFADIYYPTVTQGRMGQIEKTWVLDKTIVCNATTIGGAGTEEIRPEVFVQNEGKLIARSKVDLRYNSESLKQAPTNIIITNIRLCDGTLVYKETAGPRAGLGTVYELGTIEPFINPFGQIEYYKMLWRKTENQSVGEIVDES